MRYLKYQNTGILTLRPVTPIGAPSPYTIRLPEKPVQISIEQLTRLKKTGDPAPPENIRPRPRDPEIRTSTQTRPRPRDPEIRTSTQTRPRHKEPNPGNTTPRTSTQTRPRPRDPSPENAAHRPSTWNRPERPPDPGSRTPNPESQRRVRKDNTRLPETQHFLATGTTFPATPTRT